MTEGVGRWLLVFAAIVWPTFAPGQETASPSPETPEVNEYCPVWPERRARAEHTLTYKGREVRFCCSTCVRLFQANPDKYLHNVPQLAGLADERPSLRQRLARFLSGTNTQLWLFSFLGILTVLLLVAASRRRRKLSQAPVRLGYETVVLIVVAFGAILGLGYQVLALQAENKRLRYENWLFGIERLMHNNTFIDYGEPPIPARPPIGPRLESTWYRGNDERSDKLFNGGHYLTALFRLSLHGSDGRKLAAGGSVGEEWIEVRYEIERAPNTPDAFWTEEVMGVIYLTRQTDRFLGLERPVEDRVDLTVLEPFERWEALYPIGRVSGDTGEGRFQGVIYVADEWRQFTRPVGASLHYGIVYDVVIEDGRIAAESDLWMGSLFRPRKSPIWKIPAEQWFSHEPIPPLPEPGVDDPDLLGLTDYYEAPELPESPP